MNSTGPLTTDNIVEILEIELAHHQRAMPRPDFLFLGVREHDAFKSKAANFTTIGDPLKDEAQRLEWRGIPVYRVDAVTALHFSNNPPSPVG